MDTVKTGEVQNTKEDVKAVEQQPAQQEMPQMQYLFVQLADGRRGTFVGPVLIKEAELILNPPRIAEVVFSKPVSRPGVEGLQNAEEKKGTEAVVDLPSGSDQKDLAVEPKA